MLQERKSLLDFLRKRNHEECKRISMETRQQLKLKGKQDELQRQYRKNQH
ncbi:unnamed protein product [Tetraodon nigroviridis]|uniref:(spotted green pufferfish) hypothetical protein n=1 Tax=Tetraodon nigroviridis TaxID=99883 RepID=Q4SDF2_TETNG|nr:unnamed protein product [Tetraodon nigroviridis]